MQNNLPCSVLEQGRLLYQIAVFCLTHTAVSASCPSCPGFYTCSPLMPLFTLPPYFLMTVWQIVFRKKILIFCGMPLCCHSRTDGPKIIHSYYGQFASTIRALRSFGSVSGTGRKRMPSFANPVIIPVVVSSDIPSSQSPILLHVPFANHLRIDCRKTVDLRFYAMSRTFRTPSTCGTIAGCRFPYMPAFGAAPAILCIAMQCNLIRRNVTVSLIVPLLG